MTVANSGTGSMTLQGSAATLNTYLNDTTKIEFTASSNDTTTATLTVTPSDGTATGTADTISINVTSVNDAPTLVAN
ncbi:VCBS domain-containing protein [Phaeobacter inhibens]|uniref:VCBS domain-containing protein n=1 Tax=Phaeobacter inhibens TaxID=221822 RepID=UPI0021A5CED4|nr:VCBS domain-containing protein [Phaeobacter inhibens]